MTPKQRTVAFSFGATTLLIFQLGRTAADQVDSGGVIPGHGPSSPIISQLLPTEDQSAGEEKAKLKQHFCIAVLNPEDVEKWDAHLQAQGVTITGRMNWELGGKSVYFEDIDGHVGEIGSRGIWPHYKLE
jgi:catechol 2,3-dioxygenase-like lactoylglutathione lyase family enzyme